MSGTAPLAGAVHPLLLAMSEQARQGIGAVGLAAGCALAVGLAAVLGVHRVSGRNAAVASWMAPVAVVATVGTGVLVSAWAMVLGPEQVATMASVLAVTATIAAAVGLTLAREVRRAEQRHAVAEAQRQRDASVAAQRQRLVSWVSHDLRTPLARMQAITEALSDGVAPDPQRYLDRLAGEVSGLALLVDDLLALSRLTSSEAPLRAERLDLADLLSDAVAGAGPQARARGLNLAGDAGPGSVLADPRDLHRALANLLDNAMRHTPAGGTVSVAGRVEDGRAVIEVHDGCGGIPEDQLGSLFEPGWRGDTARRPDGEGRAGLGLAIVAHVAQRHGGSVEAANRGPGCVFTIALPAAGPGDRHDGQR